MGDPISFHTIPYHTSVSVRVDCKCEAATSVMGRGEGGGEEWPFFFLTLMPFFRI